MLEALHIMGYGRSFRGRVRDGLIRQGADALNVYLEWQDAQNSPRKAGLAHRGNAWEARLDGETVAQLGNLCAAMAVLVFEPASHALVSSGAEPRRRFMDWGLFHVEHGYYPLWRRYMRALKQRNALLKQSKIAGLDAWDAELGACGEAIQRYRQAYWEQLLPHVQDVAAQMVPAFGEADIALNSGWKQAEMPLVDALLLSRQRDMMQGHTSQGVHRADWSLLFAGRVAGEAYSRGQAKLVALTCLLAQARLHHARKGEWPLFLLDDFASELDARHRRLVLEQLLQGGAQVFMSGVEPPTELAGMPAKLFHVEHGVVTPLDSA